MCGISGIFHFKHEIDRLQLEQFNRRLTHRGPDNQSVYISASEQLGLGHCRLSIVDLSDEANQPFLSPDKRFVMTFNGEIYNYREIREELMALGYRFSTGSDTEVLLLAYQHWGASCLHKLNGMWAFAIWDNQTETLFLARDRFGVKPLYYRADDEHFSFASEQKAFVEHPRGLEICPHQASMLMVYPEAVESQRETLYRDLNKVLPGECMTVTAGKIAVTRWWNTYQVLCKQGAQDSDEVSLTTMFRDACEIRTRTDVKIATALSGGLDSSAVTAQLAAIPGLKNDKQLKAFIGSFSGSDLDEFSWAKQVVDQYQLPFERVAVNQDDALELVEASCLAMEDVNDLPAIGQWKLYQAMHQDGYKVSVEGHGGDELFAGYHRHMNVYLGDVIRCRENLSELAQTMVTLGAMRPSAGAAFVKGNLLQAPLDASGLHGKLSGQKLYLKQLLKGERDFSQHIVQEQKDAKYGKESLLFQKLYEDFHYFTLPYILRNYDRISMRNSVEIRSPFLDFRFVLQAFRCPEQCRIHRGRTKSLLRDHFTFIPQGVRERIDKSGFTPPVNQWMASGLAGWMSGLLNDSCVTQSNLFDGKALKGLLENYLSQGRADKVMLYWPLINLALLERGNQ